MPVIPSTRFLRQRDAMGCWSDRTAAEHAAESHFASDDAASRTCHRGHLCGKKRCPSISTPRAFCYGRRVPATDRPRGTDRRRRPIRSSWPVFARAPAALGTARLRNQMLARPRIWQDRDAGFEAVRFGRPRLRRAAGCRALTLRWPNREPRPPTHRRPSARRRVVRRVRRLP